MENQINYDTIYLPFDDIECIYDYDYLYKKSLFNVPKKINYYKIFSLSNNTFTFILTHRNEINHIYSTNKNLLKHIFDKEH